MSILSQLPVEDYDRNAFQHFKGLPDFDMADAKALVWAAQVAYETVEPAKVDPIVDRWGFTSTTILPRSPRRFGRCEITPGLILANREVTIIAFPGLDPLSLGDWIMASDGRLSAAGTHTGFQHAIEQVWDSIASAVIAGARQGRRLFLIGHSAGGAQAVITAARIAQHLNTEVSGVYTFGAVRPGGSSFVEQYPCRATTYRFIYGDDVLTAWPILAKGYRHAGLSLQCRHGGDFRRSSPQGEPDERRFYPILRTGFRHWCPAVGLPRRLSARSDFFGRVFRYLPPPIADHVPDRYIAALDPLPG